MDFVLLVPSRVKEKLQREARELGVSLEEVILEKLEESVLDPKDRALDYVEVAEYMLNKAEKELKKGDLRQASEKIWGAAALSVKAYAYWREGKRLVSHRELWDYTRRMVSELGDWIKDAWAHANIMHINFYEGWAFHEHVEEALRKVKQLVKAVAEKINPNNIPYT